MDNSNQCVRCYHKLPDPKFELNYFLWSPGFVYKPKKLKKISSSVSSHASRSYSSAKSSSKYCSSPELISILGDESKIPLIKSKFEAASKNGKLDVQKASELARQLGMSPSQDDEKVFSQKYGDQMDYSTFEKYLSFVSHKDETVDDLVELFIAYDINESGELSANQIINILTQYGESLSVAEASAIIKKLGYGDRVNYREFLQRLIE